MIFTVGKKAIYDPLFETIDVITKAAGGSVWNTYEQAEDYLREVNPAGFEIYGVQADFVKDTTDGGGSWRTLTKSAALIKLTDEETA